MKDKKRSGEAAPVDEASSEFADRADRAVDEAVGTAADPVDSALDDASESASADAEPGVDTPSATAAEVDAVERELTQELEQARSADAVDPDVELQALRGELEVLQDRHLRTMAEYDNYRKRTAQQLQSAWTRAQADLIGSFLEALDDLQRVGTWEESTTDLSALIEGVDLVERKFSQALAGAGVEAFDPTGEVFDPNTMEAMMKVPTEEADQEDHVAEVFQKGYMIKGTLVRPARVGVYKSD